MAKRIDLTGKKFGRWLVLGYAGNRNWLCRCSCENKTERLVNGNTLRRGLSVSCGCYRKEQRKQSEADKELTDLIGVVRGDYKALQNIGNNIWKCQCIYCGAIENIPRRTFMNCKKTCVCQQYQLDLTNKVFGKWTVLKYAGKSKWLCKCECGVESLVSTSKLITGQSTKCKSSHHRPTHVIVYPQWFIDELADKSVAKSINTHSIAEFICPVHGIYKQRVGDHIRLLDNSRRFGCPKCSASLASRGSKNENTILDYIQKWFPSLDILLHDRTVLDGQEIDIYIPSLKVGIEYNGSAYHASKNALYENKDKYYHRDKFLRARERGIHLITVFDKDYAEHKWQILEKIRHVLQGKKQFFIPDNEIVITDNDYDIGTWLKTYNYEEVEQIEPESFTYDRNRLVYRCGKTKWIHKEEFINE